MEESLKSLVDTLSKKHLKNIIMYFHKSRLALSFDLSNKLVISYADL